MNTLAYSDLTDTNVSKGSSISSVGQQLSQSFGVALSATILSLISISFFARLSADDGCQVSGHRPAQT